jgi:hypothetical protein
MATFQSSEQLSELVNIRRSLRRGTRTSWMLAALAIAGECKRPRS